MWQFMTSCVADLSTSHCLSLSVLLTACSWKYLFWCLSKGVFHSIISCWFRGHTRGHPHFRFLVIASLLSFWQTWQNDTALQDSIFHISVLWTSIRTYRHICIYVFCTICKFEGFSMFRTQVIGWGMHQPWVMISHCHMTVMHIFLKQCLFWLH